MDLTSGCGDIYRSQLSHRTVPHPTSLIRGRLSIWPKGRTA
jgi:hypothetical protein